MGRLSAVNVKIEQMLGVNQQKSIHTGDYMGEENARVLEPTL